MAWRHNWTSYNDHILTSIIVKIVITFSSLLHCFCFRRQPYIKRVEKNGNCRAKKIWDICFSIWWSSRCRIITAAHKICTTITRRYPLNNTSLLPFPTKKLSFSCQAKNIASAIPMLLIFRFIFQDFSIIYTFFLYLSVVPASVLCAFKRIYFHNFCYQTLKHESRNVWRKNNTRNIKKSSKNLNLFRL